MIKSPNESQNISLKKQNKQNKQNDFYCIRAVYLPRGYDITWNEMRINMWKKMGRKPTHDDMMKVLIDLYVSTMK
jgi:DNA-binding ferritin-like protein (Dps family)